MTFECRDAADPALAGSFDLVTLFETLHDMAHPVQALAAARSMLTPEGAVLVGDEKVADRFAAPGDEMERFNYGWSALHCLAAAMTEADSAATGTSSARRRCGRTRRRPASGRAPCCRSSTTSGGSTASTRRSGSP